MQDELTCPECQTRMRYAFEQGKIQCPACGYAPLDAQRESVRLRPQPKYKRLSHRGEVNYNALSAYHSAIHALTDGDTDGALRALERALYFQEDFADARIIMADLTDDVDQKRKHLSVILAVDSLNSEALKRLMVLDGRMTAEQAAQLEQATGPDIETAAGPVPTRTEVLLCPVCQGRLTINEAQGRVECAFCGHTEALEDKAPFGPEESLTLALLERKVQPVRWVIGERLLHCNECAAERTIPARKLSAHCPFCGSNHVILQDAMQSFEQPEGLVPFQVSQQAAVNAIRQKLNRIWQRIANVFNNNRVKRGMLEGVYLPFWYFDAVMEVTQTRTYERRANYANFDMPRMPTRSTFVDGLNDIAIHAADSPPVAMINRLGRYDLRQLQVYSPKLLARYPAELYTRDFDVASLDARSVASRTMRKKHEEPPLGEQNTRISVFSVVKHMSFRLLLLPVWVGMLEEEDGDMRPALVNGQTGKVVLGKAVKSTPNG